MVLPLIRQEFWEQYDGTLQETMPGAPDKTRYIQVRRMKRKATENVDLRDAWNALNASAQRVSVHRDAESDFATRGLIERVLNEIDEAIFDIRSREITFADDLFAYEHGGPPALNFGRWPILFPANSPWGVKGILAFVGAAYQIPVMRSNVLDEGITMSASSVMLAPLINLKSRIMRNLFGVEVEKKISPEELKALFSSVAPGTSPPLHLKTGAEAIGDESTPAPDPAQTAEAMKGAKILTFVPEEGHWAKFAKLVEKDSEESPYQSPEDPIFADTNSLGPAPEDA